MITLKTKVFRKLTASTKYLNVHFETFSCPEGWLQFESDCFYFAGDEYRKSWSEAVDYCHTLDAYLAEVHDEETQTFLSNHASGFSKTSWWLGASDQAKVNTIVNCTNILTSPD